MKMKCVYYDLKIRVEVHMPANEDPSDIFVDMDYEFFTPRGAEVIDTDIYDESHKVTGEWEVEDEQTLTNIITCDII